MLYVMNTSIIPPLFEGRMIVRNISNWEAIGLLERIVFTSAVGHESSAVVLSHILGVNIPFNRITIRVESGDMILAFQLEERLPEGFTPTSDELLNLKYSLRLIIFE
jgi:hypothetical protein